jgi:hypothetical protein
MNFPFAGIFVSANESIKVVIHKRYNPSIATFLVSGYFAGALAAYVTTPMDLIKTYL